jgi:heme/copper-type cytochrome/quinol oxidase subunit 2
MDRFVFLLAALICLLVMGVVMWVTMRMRRDHGARDGNGR